MRRQIRQRMWLWGVFILLIGCRESDAGERSTAVPMQEATPAAMIAQVLVEVTPTIDAPSLTQRLDDAVALWQSHHIIRYTVVINYARDNGSTQYLTLVVENGQVMEAGQTCYPERDCTLEKLNPEEFTIERLFEIARTLIEQGNITDVTYNPTYGYPNAVVHEDVFWATNGFQVLDPAP